MWGRRSKLYQTILVSVNFPGGIKTRLVVGCFLANASERFVGLIVSMRCNGEEKGGMEGNHEARSTMGAIF